MNKKKTVIVIALLLFAVGGGVAASFLLMPVDSPTEPVTETPIEPVVSQADEEPVIIPGDDDETLPELPSAPEPVTEPTSETQEVQPAPVPAWGYGIQAHMLGGGDRISFAAQSTKDLGFNWIKQQVRWDEFEPNPGNRDFEELDWIRAEADRLDLSILLSLMAAPDWAREEGFAEGVEGPPAEPDTLASFAAEVAERYCGSSIRAMEIWNEQNLHYEWGDLPIEPAAYIQMLSVVSGAVRESCPSMMIVSGALTPAGTAARADGFVLAIDDLEYLKGMLELGLLDHVDAVGAHPSGYNVPPTATLQDYCNVIQETGMDNFDAGCATGNPHRSFSFRSTMESYREAVAAVDPSVLIWPTEFGWAVADPPGYPNYAYALDNSMEEQAQWTVQAYEMMREWGWVAAPILWNLNYRIEGAGTEREQWGILDAEGMPLATFTHLSAMEK